MSRCPSAFCLISNLHFTCLSLCTRYLPQSSSSHPAQINKERLHGKIFCKLWLPLDSFPKSCMGPSGSLPPPSWMLSAASTSMNLTLPARFLTSWPGGMDDGSIGLMDGRVTCSCWQIKGAYTYDDKLFHSSFGAYGTVNCT